MTTNSIFELLAGCTDAAGVTTMTTPTTPPQPLVRRPAGLGVTCCAPAARLSSATRTPAACDSSLRMHSSAASAVQAAGGGGVSVNPTTTLLSLEAHNHVRGVWFCSTQCAQPGRAVSQCPAFLLRQQAPLPPNHTPAAAPARGTCPVATRALLHGRAHTQRTRACALAAGPLPSPSLGAVRSSGFYAQAYRYCIDVFFNKYGGSWEATYQRWSTQVGMGFFDHAHNSLSTCIVSAVLR